MLCCDGTISKRHVPGFLVGSDSDVDFHYFINSKIIYFCNIFIPNQTLFIRVCIVSLVFI